LDTFAYVLSLVLSFILGSARLCSNVWESFDLFVLRELEIGVLGDLNWCRQEDWVLEQPPEVGKVELGESDPHSTWQTRVEQSLDTLLVLRKLKLLQSTLDLVELGVIEWGSCRPFKSTDDFLHGNVNQLRLLHSLTSDRALSVLLLEHRKVLRLGLRANGGLWKLWFCWYWPREIKRPCGAVSGV
jgi:hypothetical protein